MMNLLSSVTNARHDHPGQKVNPVNEQQVRAQKGCRTRLWAIYDDLKAFKAEPSVAQ